MNFGPMFGEREQEYFDEFLRVLHSHLGISLSRKGNSGSKSFGDDDDVYTDGIVDYLQYICPEEGYFDVLTSSDIYYRIEEDRVEQWKRGTGDSPDIKLNTFLIFY